jgi:hypothetical protein
MTPLADKGDKSLLPILSLNLPDYDPSQKGYETQTVKN